MGSSIIFSSLIGLNIEVRVSVRVRFIVRVRVRVRVRYNLDPLCPFISILCCPEPLVSYLTVDFNNK